MSDRLQVATMLLMDNITLGAKPDMGTVSRALAWADALIETETKTAEAARARLEKLRQEIGWYNGPTPTLIPPGSGGT